MQAFTINVPKGTECVTVENGDETTVHIYPYGHERKVFNNTNENINENSVCNQTTMQAEIIAVEKTTEPETPNQAVQKQSLTTGQLLWFHAKDTLTMLTFFAFAGLVSGAPRDRHD